MRIRITKDCTLAGKTYKADGKETEVDDDIGRNLVSTGYAEDLETRPQRQHGALDEKGIKAKQEAEEAGEELMRVRFRRPHTVGGKDYAGGVVDMIPADDDGWEAVNVGACDLDPAPGINGQPFPPEWVRSSPASEAPVPLQTVAGRQDIQGVPATGQQRQPATVGNAPKGPAGGDGKKKEGDGK